MKIPRNGKGPTAASHGTTLKEFSMRSNRILSFAIAACMSLAAGFMAAALAVATTARRCWDTIAAWASPPEVIQRKSPDQARQSVALVTAHSYVLRMLRRNRPDVTPGWRMCPSI